MTAMPTQLTQDQLAQCANEPIRIPGAIQPHGWLAVVTLRSGELLAYSQNWQSLLQRDPSDLASLVEDTLREAIDGRHGLVDGEGPI